MSLPRSKLAAVPTPLSPDELLADEPRGEGYMDVYHRSSAPRLWHYTSNAACLSILQGRSLWASDIRYLNDALEYSYASLLAAEIASELTRSSNSDRSRLAAAIGERFPHDGVGSTDTTFVFSMSANRDDLSQWRAYCPTGGVALGIEPRRLQYFAGPTARLVRCTYNEDGQRSIILTSFDEAMDIYSRTRSITDGVHSFQKSFGSRLAEFKHPSFAGEEEFRLILQPPTANDYCNPAIKVRAGKTMLVRYLEVSFGTDNSLAWLIPEMVTAPAPYPQLAEEAARAALCPHFSIPDVIDVRASESSYRHWL